MAACRESSKLDMDVVCDGRMTLHELLSYMRSLLQFEEPDLALELIDTLEEMAPSADVLGLSAEVWTETKYQIDCKLEESWRERCPWTTFLTNIPEGLEEQDEADEEEEDEMLPWQEPQQPLRSACPNVRGDDAVRVPTWKGSQGSLSTLESLSCNESQGAATGSSTPSDDTHECGDKTSQLLGALPSQLPDKLEEATNAFAEKFFVEEFHMVPRNLKSPDTMMGHACTDEHAMPPSRLPGFSTYTRA
eukprot:TRINITY_DN65664_c0_g1_i1.p1 TRINITY_DN65664_c0_g1~~TRINITY_DN65664_c0_g1_i1.p1  ORF type:complete len:248 (-),score=43.39 TRINITY_DN65664_c0_g1_i1:350-1093(-)